MTQYFLNNEFDYWCLEIILNESTIFIKFLWKENHLKSYSIYSIENTCQSNVGHTTTTKLVFFLMQPTWDLWQDYELHESQSNNKQQQREQQHKQIKLFMSNALF